MRSGRLVLKSLFLLLAVGLATWDMKAEHEKRAATVTEALPPELYEVSDFRRNGLPVLDSTRWQNIALEGRQAATFKGGDTVLPLSYGRRFFIYDVDTATQRFAMTNPQTGEQPGSFRYRRPDSSHIVMDGTYGADSLHFVMIRTRPHFQLTERQFNWLSESNR